jgi:hypothetical protein
LGADLSHVRIHLGQRAAASAAGLNALAYTLGSDIVFAAGRYAPQTEPGLRILGHELAHVLEQSRYPARQPTIRRTTEVQIKVGKGKAAKTMTVVVGGVEFSSNAKADVLKQGGLLPGPDQAHIAFHGNLLAYDKTYAAPQDPFRWSKVRELIDSDEKIKVDKVSIADSVKVKFVTPKGQRVIDQAMMSTGAAGLTLPTETLQKAIYPNETTYTCSPNADAHEIYYTGVMSSSAAQSELAHELFGHMWLAMKKVPYLHPSDPQRAKTIGTLSASHGIQDPLGQPFTGTVADYIGKFISSQTYAAFSSPTQFVSPSLFAQSLADFKSLFVKGSSKKPDGGWSVSDPAGLAWEKLANNFRFAASGSTAAPPAATVAGAGPAAAARPSPAAKPAAPAPAKAPAGPSPASTPAVPAPASPTAGPSPATAAAPPGSLTQAAVVKDLSAWYSGLAADQKYVLERMLDDIKRSFNRNGDLAVALLRVIKP